MRINKAEFRPAEEAAIILGIASNEVQVTRSPLAIEVTLVYSKGEKIKIVGDVPADKQAAIEAWAREILG